MASFLRAVSGQRYGPALRRGPAGARRRRHAGHHRKGTPAAGKIQAKTATRVGFISGRSASPAP